MCKRGRVRLWIRVNVDRKKGAPTLPLPRLCLPTRKKKKEEYRTRMDRVMVRIKVSLTLP